MNVPLTVGPSFVLKTWHISSPDHSKHHCNSGECSATSGLTRIIYQVVFIIYSVNCLVSELACPPSPGDCVCVRACARACVLVDRHLMIKGEAAPLDMFIRHMRLSPPVIFNRCFFY